MSRLKALGFLLVFVVPALMPIAAWLGVATGQPDAAAWFPLLFLFVLLPALDFVLGHDPANVPAEAEVAVARSRWFMGLTLLAVPVQAVLIPWSAAWFAHAGFGPIGIAGWLLAQGVVGGILAINTAHELIHKDGRLERAAGGLLLASVGYHGFKVEHLRGHHVHVATPADASTARRGQSLWGFLPRAMWRNTVAAWRLEAARLRGLGLSPWHRRNELLGWTAVWIAMGTGLTLWLGPIGGIFFVAQGLIAAASLEVINYVEHYGLERARRDDGRYERVAPVHSWNSDFALSNLLLFQLQRHSDHHAFPKRRYSVLRHRPEAPQLPGGYAAMFVLAFCPPLWRRIVHPRLDAVAQAA
ncbi:MAG: alkane 1-monooxygenase [Arenimonas sp.]